MFQRPQHLMTRCARERRVFFFEEPEFGAPRAELRTLRDEVHGVTVCVPHLPSGLDPATVVDEQRRMLAELMQAHGIDRPVLWFYTPVALTFARHVPASQIVFDCMDELSAFRGAPPDLLTLEAELLAKADLVFTGGQSLYEAKRQRHPRVYAFPSSVDVPHFAAARTPGTDPHDQAAIPRPRLGFFGVIDERMDLELIDAVARSRPEWQIVMLGPCVKIDPAILPRRPNIHFLGMKKYGELPGYLSGWDVALLPFARNESTRFISPTKTPEYLAAGRPVVSTSVRDVVRPYGDEGLVLIADSADEFIDAVERALAAPPPRWLSRVDDFLSRMSWDRTWAEMSRLIDRPASRAARAAASDPRVRPNADVSRRQPAPPSF